MRYQSKTRRFLVANQCRKLGLVLPTPSQYDNMSKHDRQYLARTVRQYQHADGIEAKSRAFHKFLKAQKQYNMNGELKKEVRLANTRANIEEFAANEAGRILHNYALKGKEHVEYVDYMFKPEVQEYLSFRDSSVSELRMDSTEVEKLMSEYEYYENRDGTGWITIDPNGESSVSAKANPTSSAHYFANGDEAPNVSGAFVGFSVTKPISRKSRHEVIKHIKQKI